MSNLINELMGQLGPQVIQQMSSKLGADSQSTGNAIQAALPFLVKALANNTQSGNGASALQNALQKDHDGSILNDLGGFVNNFQDGPGAGILKHILGGKRNGVENAISQISGVNKAQTGGLLEMLAPVVLGQLGRQNKEQNWDASGLSNILKGERQQVEEKTDNAFGGILNQILDKDGDGNLKNEATQMGMKFLGNLFKR